MKENREVIGDEKQRKNKDESLKRERKIGKENERIIKMERSERIQQKFD